MSQNVVLLSGNLGRDLEVKYTSGGKALATGSIAISFGSGDKKGTDWFNFSLWDELATNAAKYLRKGDYVTLTGRLKSRQYAKDGQNRTVYEVVVSSFSLPITRAEKPEPAAPVMEDDDIPF